MAVRQNRPVNEIAITAHLADLSADSTAYAVATHRGRIVRKTTLGLSDDKV